MPAQDERAEQCRGGRACRERPRRLRSAAAVVQPAAARAGGGAGRALAMGQPRQLRRARPRRHREHRRRAGAEHRQRDRACRSRAAQRRARPRGRPLARRARRCARRGAAGPAARAAAAAGEHPASPTRPACVRYGRGVAEAPRTEVGDREYFVRTRDGGSPGPVVAGPIRSRLGEHWVVVVARPLRDARGAFAGAIFANVDVARFALLLEAVDLGRAGAVSVRGGDLALVARRSAGDALSTPLGSRTVSAELQDELAGTPMQAASSHAPRWTASSASAILPARRRDAHPRDRRAGQRRLSRRTGARRRATWPMLAALVLTLLAASSLLLQRA